LTVLAAVFVFSADTDGVILEVFSIGRDAVAGTSGEEVGISVAAEGVGDVGSSKSDATLIFFLNLLN
jgi:hypothetical protein